MEPLSAPHAIALVAHLLLFVYWLGADVGVFYSSGFVVNPGLTREARLTAAKIMLNLDLIPRICMSLMLTVSGLLTEFYGIPHPWWQMAGIIALGPVWLGMVLFLHFREGTAAAHRVQRLDFAFRGFMIAAVVTSAGYSLGWDRLDANPWIAAKLLVFAFLIFCGLMICLSGSALHATKLAELSRSVGLVSQEVQIFRASVRDNLTFFDHSIPDDKISQVIVEFELGDWLRTLPEGLDTELGSTGLSAGQAQLLSYARVALREPGLVILDEATSRLDLATEALIDRATERLLKGRTGIIIAHRLQTIQKADRIMILEAGSIIEYDERLTLLQNPNSRFSHLLSTGLEDVLA